MAADRAAGNPEDEQQAHDLLAAIATALGESAAEVEVGAITFATIKRFAAGGEPWAQHWEHFAKYDSVREMVDTFLPGSPTRDDVAHFVAMFPRLAHLKYGPPAAEDTAEPEQEPEAEL